MTERPAGPDPPAPALEPWTCDDVERWLIAAFGVLATTPLYSPGGNTLSASTWANADVPSSTFDIVAFTGTVLGNTSRERRVLLFWARVKAGRSGVWQSVSAFCKEAGIDRRQFDRLRVRACAKVAAAKNRVDGRGAR